MLISVIVSTYNRPKALELVLRALDNQTQDQFEVVVADDGSREDTREVVEKLKETVSYPLFHAWQEDDGFRLARVRNLAVRKSHGEYLLFLDGDCVPQTSFIEKHRSLAEKGWVVAGNRVLLSQTFTTTVEQKGLDLSSKSLLFWLKEKFRGNVNRAFSLMKLPLGSLRKRSRNDWRKLRGCNIGVWRSDYENVNGFDSSFRGWGLEDTDFAVRLLNAGVSIKRGFFATTVLHLWHREAPRDNEQLNRDVALERLKTGVFKAEDGLMQIQD